MNGIGQKPARLFIALLPESAFEQKLLCLKARVREIAGSQLYLDHPPHLTIYLSSFTSVEVAAVALQEWTKAVDAPTLGVQGWHVFEADPLTGCHSLVCKLRDDDEAHLRLTQTSLVERLAPLRDRTESTARFQASRMRFSPEEWKNVEHWGFPYLGPIWRPHFTVASIRPDDWQQVWDELWDNAPVGSVLCLELALYRLELENPTLVARFRLR